MYALAIFALAIYVAMGDHFSCLWHSKCPVGDVFAIEEVIAVDFLYLLIYFGLCLGDVFACRNTHHHATAVGFQYAVVVLRSHVEDRTIEELNSFNNSAFRIVARVALRSKYDTDGGFVLPL